MGEIQKMYLDYKDIVEFRLIYINEAHPADGRSPVGYARKMNLTNHTSLTQRCASAQKMVSNKSLTIPMLADGMDNKVNEAYKAFPNRIFLVRKDGRIAVAAAPGPTGFVPALRRAQVWLKKFRKTGEEPALPKKGKAADEE